MLILYTVGLLDPATLPSNYDTSPLTPHQCYGTDIPLPGQAERMVKHVAGCEHTAHLGCLKILKKIGVEPILGNQSGDHVVQHLLPQRQGSNLIFLLNPRYLQLLCILCSLFTKGSAFLQVLFPIDSPAMSFPSSHHHLLTLQPCDFRRPSTLRFANVPINFHPLHHAPRAPFFEKKKVNLLLG